MKFPVTVKHLLDGKWQARSIGTVAGEVTVVGDSKEASLEKIANEIRYRIEWCPCSAVSEEFVELDVKQAAEPRYPGSVF